MQPGPRIGQGRTAEIFTWGEDEVLKLFRPEFSSAEVSAHEAELARMIYAAGAPSPAIGDLVEIDGRAGIIYERIDGPSLEARVTANLWRIPEVARTLAETQVAVQSCSVPALQPLRDLLRWKIGHAAPLSAALRARALSALERLPDGTALCHGDFHLGNVLLSRRGPLVIDWENATNGHPLADVARTLVTLRLGWVYTKSPAQHMLLRGAITVLLAFYLHRYRQLRPAPRQELDAWMLPVAAGRLSEAIAEEQPHLLALVARLAAQAGKS